MKTMKDYQERYLAHQQHGKKTELIQLMKERHSHRRFSDTEIEQEVIEALAESIKHTPSSCDRHGVRIKRVSQRDEKALLNGLLVGGVGFVYRVPEIFMLWADSEAYRGGIPSGSELQYNSYLDAGIMIQQLWLVAQSLGLHACFVNPQVRIENQKYFNKRFKPKGWKKPVFCGAFCFGYPHEEVIQKKRNINFDVFVD